MELVLQPYREVNFHRHTGPFLFEFQWHGLPADEFFARLDAFLGALPTDFRYAIEIRNPGLLGERYARLLDKHGVAHVYNHWTVMPSLAAQHAAHEVVHRALYRAATTHPIGDVL